MLLWRPEDLQEPEGRRHWMHMASMLNNGHLRGIRISDATDAVWLAWLLQGFQVRGRLL